MGESIYSNLHRVFTITKIHPQEEEAEHLGPWIMWRLWKNRNELLIKGEDYNAMDTIMKAKEDMEEWKSRKEVTKKTEGALPQPAPQPRKPWTPPPKGWLKCNVDGNWTADAGHNGVGWILRDDSGRVRWIGAKKISRQRSILEVEAEALRWAIHMTSNFSYDNIVFKTDSKELLEAIDKSVGWPRLRTVAEDNTCHALRYSESQSGFQPEGK